MRAHKTLAVQKVHVHYFNISNYCILNTLLCYFSGNNIANVCPLILLANLNDNNNNNNDNNNNTTSNFSANSTTINSSNANDSLHI